MDPEQEAQVWAAAIDGNKKIEISAGDMDSLLAAIFMLQNSVILSLTAALTKDASPMESSESLMEAMDKASLSLDALVAFRKTIAARLSKR